MSRADLVVVGAGLVGLATALRRLERTPGAAVVVIDKEPRVAAHQSGHNSGVVHSGIYYRPGSLKARLCRQGKAALQALCCSEDIPLINCGKVIVASDATEAARLPALLERGRANDVACRLITAAELRELEPHAVGHAAIAVPEAGIVDYALVARRLAARVERLGGELRLNTAAIRITEDLGKAHVRLETGPSIHASQAIVCAGLHSDRLAGAAAAGVQIVPFRGEFYTLARPELCRGLIYPTPDPTLPFLGVHLTRTVGGGVHCGPNAVLALARQGYRWRDVSLQDTAQIARSRGFWRLARRHWRVGLTEVARSASRRRFAASLRRLVPSVRAEDLTRAPAGVRAQAVAPDGSMVDDFVFAGSARVLHVINAPSPAATACLAIGAHLDGEADSRLGATR